MRDRATLYLEQIGGAAGGPEAITAPWAVPGANLEAALHAYLDGPTDAPFDLVRAATQPPASAATVQQSRWGIRTWERLRA